MSTDIGLTQDPARADVIAAELARLGQSPEPPEDPWEPQQLDDPGDGIVCRKARITWASQIEPEPVVWAWEEDGAGRVPAGSLSVAAGREGTGKSSFGIWLAGQITRGTLPGSYFGVPRSVFYVAVEDSWKYTLVPRLIAAGADLSRVGRFDVISDIGDEVTLSLPSDNALLEQEILSHQVALVVIDPLMSVIGERIDTHRTRDVRTALDPLAKMADRTGSVLLGIAHFNKGNGTDAASLITGSGAFKDVPRSIFGFARDEADETGGRVMSQVKNSLGRDDLPSLSYLIESAEISTRKGPAVTGRFTFTGTSDRSVADVLRDAHTGDEPVERDDAAAWLTDYLEQQGGAAPKADIDKAAKAAGIASATLKRARTRAGVRYESSGFPRRTYWLLNAVGSQSAQSDHPLELDPTGPTGDLTGREELAEGTEELKNQKLSSSDSSVSPSARCSTCHQPMTVVEPGQTTHPGCEVLA